MSFSWITTISTIWTSDNIFVICFCFNDGSSCPVVSIIKSINEPQFILFCCHDFSNLSSCHEYHIGSYIFYNAFFQRSSFLESSLHNQYKDEPRLWIYPNSNTESNPFHKRTLRICRIFGSYKNTTITSGILFRNAQTCHL